MYTVCGGGPIPIPGPVLTYQIPSAHKTNPVTRAEELLEYQQTLAQVLTIYHHLILAQHRSDQNPPAHKSTLAPRVPDLQHQRKTTDSSKRGGTRLSDSLSTHRRIYTSQVPQPTCFWTFIAVGEPNYTYTSLTPPQSLGDRHCFPLYPNSFFSAPLFLINLLFDVPPTFAVAVRSEHKLGSQNQFHKNAIQSVTWF